MIASAPIPTATAGALPTAKAVALGVGESTGSGNILQADAASEPAATPDSPAVPAVGEVIAEEVATVEPLPTNTNLRGLNIDQAACEIASNANSCDVFVSYNESGSGPFCLFEKQRASAQSANLITCGNPVQMRVSGVTEQGKLLELRRGSLIYEQSTLLDRRLAIGISGIQRGRYSLQDSRRSTVLKNDRASSLTTSWDGRIHFDVIATTNAKRVSVVRMYRPERTDGQSADSLQRADLFSTGHILASDNLSNAELAASRVTLPGDLGTNRIGIEVPFNIAVHPDHTLSTNPYRSGADGSANATGQFDTYQFYVIMGASRVGNIDGEHDLTIGNPARGKKFFLTRFKASVIVRNPRSNDAEVHDVIIHSAAQPLRDNNGSLIYGYEPSVTLDGRLIVYSGNSFPARRNGNGGEISYTFQSNPENISQWSVPRNLAEMYNTHGPGASSGETRVNGGKRFSEHFPVASYPIRQYNGETLKPGDFVKGAYPWVSPRGSEVFFMARNTFHGPARSGATIGGFRTRGQLWHMDGDINNNRGNPTERYDHWSNGDGANNQYEAIVRAYESRRYPGTNTAMGAKTWNNLFVRPLAQYPTSWSATVNLNRSPLPLNPFPESYGFWLTGNRYFEYSFPLYAPDLIAYYPMNEPLYQDQTIIRAHFNADPTDPGSEAVRRSSVRHVTGETADLSQHQHTAALRNGAVYPFEFHDAINLWANTGELKDQNDGAQGNSIYFPASGRVVSQLNSRSMSAVVASQAFSTSLWFNSNTLSAQTRLLSIDGLVSLDIRQNSIRANIDNDSAQQLFEATANTQNNRWHHIALSWRHGDVRLYFDGAQVARYSVNGDLSMNTGRTAALTLGPAGSGAGNLLLKMDEVYLYATSLDSEDAITLSLRKKVFNNSQNSFFNASGMAGDYPALATSIDLSFNANDREIELGEQLFESTNLSRDNTISCASCHQASREFTDGLRVSSGINQTQGRLNTPAIANMLLSNRYFYSGGAGSLETQAIHTMMDNGEMGIFDTTQLVNSLSQSLRDQMRNVYQREPSVSDIASALASYVNTIRVTGSTRNNRSELTQAAQRGERLFNGTANCVACHSGSNFSDNRFHDIGLNSNSANRAETTGRTDDRFRTKTPTLRNVALTAPYFHDGSASDLQAVISHYNDNSHTASGRTPDPLLHPLELSQNDINDLIAYLESLNGNTRTR